MPKEYGGFVVQGDKEPLIHPHCNMNPLVA